MENGYFGYYECVITKDAHIRDATFWVTIPSLYQAKNQYKHNPAGTTSNVEADKIADGKAAKVTLVGDIEAVNHTDYYYRLRGDVFKETMEKTDGITEKRSDPAPNGAADDFLEHDHEIKKPISLFNFTFENLNNIKIMAGTKAYGFFINGSMDANMFAVTRIEGAVPLQKKNTSAYVK